jgi:hypothetical protein
MRTASVAVLITASLLIATAHGATLHVNWAGGADYTAIEPAVAAAADGDTVLVAPGTYTGAANRGVWVNSQNVVLRSQGDASNTIIDCEDQGWAITIWGSAPGDIDTTSIIEGFTFRGGVDANGPNDGGAAIECYNGSPIVRSCVFEANHGSAGGAIKLTSSEARVRDCIFRGNGAASGGAVLVTLSVNPDWAPRIERCLFYDNTATTAGGAFWCYAGETVLRGCTVVRCAAPSGAGIQINGSPNATLVERCIVAFCSGGKPIDGWDTIDALTTHSIVFGNAAGDTLGWPAHHDNRFDDPRFCGFYANDFTVCANSPALAGNNAWGVDVGSLGQGCADCDTPVSTTTWGVIKALYR